MTAPKQPVSVLVVIHTPELDVLLLERAAHPGYWQSVTGSRETDESPEITAQREVFEETGISLPLASYRNWSLTNTYEIFEQWRHRYAPGVTSNVEHVFSLCLPRPAAITASPSEHRDWQWLPWQEAAALCFSWSNRDAILMLPDRVQQGT